MPYKPGYKTTEFLVTVATSIGALVAALADALPPRYAVYAASISSGAYAISRGLTKLFPPPVVTPPPPSG
jgi:hypothetical protein